MSATQLCTFRVADLFFGVEVLKVQEVIREQVMTRVPLAHASVTGLINLRGQIVTAVDLRTRLGLPPRAADQAAMNVIVRATDGVVSLLVDDIGDVIEADEATFEAVPASVRGAARAMVTGVHKLDGTLLLVLEPDRAVDLAVHA
jgi:purine-binding chemotaxis protein CheW